MFVKEDDIEEQKMAMKVLRLGRKKKKKKKTYSCFLKNTAIDKILWEAIAMFLKRSPNMVYSRFSQIHFYSLIL